MTATIDALHVVFRVGDGDYVLPASSVLELESFSGATPVPGAPPQIAGLVQIRGHVIPVIDLRKTFGLPAVERELGHRVVVIEHAGRRVGLLVDAAREVLRLLPDAFHVPPELIVEQAQGFVKAVAQVQNRLVMLLDPSLMLSKENLNVEHQRQ